MRLLAVVLSYYPDKDKIKKDIEAFIDNVDKVLIWENTPHKDAVSYRYIDNEKIEYVSDGYNSISHALNFAWKYAVENGYYAILTMDQDSVFTDFKSYLAWVESCNEATPTICSPWYFGGHPDRAVIEREHVITSGMIIPTCILDAVGGYCQDFDIDAIDIELCVKARKQGCCILQNTECEMRQEFGSQYSKLVLGHVFSGPAYSAKRLFSIMRNYIIVYRRYDRPKFVLQQVHWYISNYIPNIIFCETNKLMKILSIACGYICGWTKRMS